MRVGLKEAAKLTGLSEWELRTGALNGKYPHMRTGSGSKGSKYIFDIHKINEIIAKKESESMVQKDNYDSNLTPFNFIRKQNLK